MVKRAAEVIQKIDALPAVEQEVLARYLAEHFEDVLDEARWQELLQGSATTLDQLAAEVDQAIAAGDVAPLDPDEL